MDIAKTCIKNISIIVPVYNEIDNLKILLDSINNTLAELSHCQHECIFVNDGSTDGTREELNQLAENIHTLHVVHLAQNYGQSAALIAGLRRARGEYIITLDGDLQNDPADIPTFLDLLDSTDFVCGYRQKRQDTIVRRLSSRVANGVRNGILHDGLHDASCGIKGFRRECVPHIIAFNGIHRFMGAILKAAEKSVTESVVNHHPRIYGKSKYGIGNRLWRGIYDLVGVTWLQRRYITPEIESESHPKP
ncbi:MAG: glycosyltransferase family 2 protein [Candidatus Hydrogenedentes bacterium]|nr:glycosyltransferase family 2 protein [Candidatus Hydrogenedentota bacterium]